MSRRTHRRLKLSDEAQAVVDAWNRSQVDGNAESGEDTHDLGQDQS